jgi:hypothetical protein
LLCKSTCLLRQKVRTPKTEAKISVPRSDSSETSTQTCCNLLVPARYVTQLFFWKIRLTTHEQTLWIRQTREQTILKKCHKLHSFKFTSTSNTTCCVWLVWTYYDKIQDRMITALKLCQCRHLCVPWYSTDQLAGKDWLRNRESELLPTTPEQLSSSMCCTLSLIFHKIYYELVADVKTLVRNQKRWNIIPLKKHSKRKRKLTSPLTSLDCTFRHSWWRKIPESLQYRNMVCQKDVSHTFQIPDTSTSTSFKTYLH